MCGRVIQSSVPLRYAIVDGPNVRDSRVHNYPPRAYSTTDHFRVPNQPQETLNHSITSVASASSAATSSRSSAARRHGHSRRARSRASGCGASARS